MARVFNGSSQYCERTSAVLTSLPVTFSCWIYATAVSRYQVAMCISRSTHPTYYDFLRLMVFNDNTVNATSIFRTTGTSSTTAGTISVNTWHHIAATFSASGGQYVWLEATKSSSGGNSQAIEGVDRTSIGREIANSTQFFPFQGRIAFPAVWNVVLSDDEIADLGRKLNGVPCGVHPARIRPESLVACWPLGGFEGDDDRDLFGAFDLTATGTPTFGESPAVIYPTGGIITDLGQVSGGGGGGIVARVMQQHGVVLGA